MPNGGEPQKNTTYVWARGIKAIGKHLVEKVTNEQGQRVLHAGVGVYATASPQDVPDSNEPTTGF